MEFAFLFKNLLFLYGFLIKLNFFQPSAHQAILNLPGIFLFLLLLLSLFSMSLYTSPLITLSPNFFPMPYKLLRLFFSGLILSLILILVTMKKESLFLKESKLLNTGYLNNSKQTLLLYFLLLSLYSNNFL
jgi:hypothetical protein